MSRRHAICIVVMITAISCGQRNTEHAASFERATVVRRLELHGAQGEVVWGLVGNGRAAMQDLTYGEVPTGFRQVVPPSGSPRALRPGECVLLLWRADDTFTRHWGTAASAHAVEYGVWESGLPAAGDSVLFQPGGANDACRPRSAGPASNSALQPTPTASSAS